MVNEKVIEAGSVLRSPLLRSCPDRMHVSNVMAFDWCPGCNYNTVCAELGCERMVVRGDRCPVHS